MRKKNDDFLQQLTGLYHEKSLFLDPADCWSYGYDNSRRHKEPLAVVFPSSHQQIIDTVLLCNTHNIAITARGSGTGTTGASVPSNGAIILSTEKMDNIISIDPDNRMMIVEPGVTNQAIQQAAAEHGFFWPPDPTSASICTVGGNLAYNSAGPRAVKYGTPRENTLGLTCITGSGETLKTGANTTKSVVGYDLTRLIIGSEGTLAIISQATLKLTPLAESKRTLQATYDSIQAAANAIARIMAQPITPCALEFMDGTAISLVKEDAQLDLPDNAQALLMIEVDGDQFGLDAIANKVAASASVDGLIDIHIAHTAEQVKQLWSARKALSPSLRKVAPKKINEDVVVPVSYIPKLINGLQALSKRYQIPIVNFGHAGNGNIHVNLLVQLEQLDRAKECLAEVFELVIQLNGSLSGEHGIGLEKRDYINLELEATAIGIMKKIKAQFDPKNLLNPDKVFPIDA
ncbi:FAD-linked oxidase C-terminal domain-containing protein [Cycloclasticus sp.]|uniref:FAD-binding oxidoreductase n=1 Tax=Cycloclasticus sp. TaxID=2024830 RepID=UPI000C0E8A61|nr:FAD-linked oxidase C-terminal domain-containing protein [Cycloclasticus sp.]PHR51839.1 MAG: FAD-binding oxidoreductase [Cycloclasticus sp.]